MESASTIQPQKQTNIVVELNYFKIEERLTELNQLKTILESNLNNLISKSCKYADIVNAVGNIFLIKSKISKWIEVKTLYALNISIVIFDEKITLLEAESFTLEMGQTIKLLDNLIDSVSSGINTNLDISLCYQQYRQQTRVYNHYLNAVNIAKTQVGKFEIDSTLLND